MVGYRGPCVVEQMIEFWKTIDDHVTLPMGMPINASRGDEIFVCSILPPTEQCSGCGKAHTFIRFEYVLQIGLQRISAADFEALARISERKGDDYRPSVSHLWNDALSKHPLRYVIESMKLDSDRVRCTTDKSCKGHHNAEKTEARMCEFSQCTESRGSQKRILVPHLLNYLEIVSTPHPCPHEDCDTRLCWPELYNHYVSAHMSPDLLPDYEHSGLCLPCPGCPFGMATASTGWGGTNMGSGTGSGLIKQYKAPECFRYIHHIAAYLFFGDTEDGVTCASWWRPCYLDSADVVELVKPRMDGAVGIVGMHPIEAFIHV